MLAARDQENLVNTHQTAAARKPLNQGNGQLHAKTPGAKAPKTPFRVPLNDENNASIFNGGKTGGLKGVGKGNENVLQTGKGDGKLDRNAFVTPLGPRTRAPLGMKTTNAKTHVLQTPAPPATSKPLLKTNKKPSSILSKSKVTIAQPEPTLTDVLSQEDESDSDVPEPEYAPPNPTPLPDPPFDFGYDETFPQFQGANLTRGFGALYSEPCDAEGVPLRVREQEKRDKENLERIDKEIQEMHEADVNEAFERMAEEPAELDRKVDEMIRRGDEKRRREQAAKASACAQRRTGPSTIKARSAATALNGNNKAPAARPSSNTTTSTKSRSTPNAPTIRPKPKPRPAFSVHSAKPISNPKSSATAPPPTTTTTTTSRPLKPATHNTLGYTRGRNVSSTIHRPPITPSTFNAKPTTSTTTPRQASRKPEEPIDQSTICPRSFRQLYGDPPMGSTMWYRVQMVESGAGLFGGKEEVEGEEGSGDGDGDGGDGLELELGLNMGLDGWDEEEVFQLKMPGEMEREGSLGVEGLEIED
ncbi:MAG: hypothetical protein Q9160_008665 [Pyrenula sp. 1 TL-2023]